jgi:hypothetical protein
MKTHEPLPRIFVQETHGDIERRSSPAFERVGVLQRMARLLGNVDDIDRPQPRRQQRLVGISPITIKKVNSLREEK